MNIRGKLRNPIFGNILIALYKEIWLILESEKIVFIIKVLILLIGFPNNKYHPNTKNYLTCLLLRGGGLVLGGRDYLFICLFIYSYPTSTKSLKKAGRGIKTWFWASFWEKIRFYQIFDEAASPQPVEKPPKTCKNSSKPIKKNSSPKPTKSLVCRGHQTFFCRVRMPAQHMPPKLLNSI